MADKNPVSSETSTSSCSRSSPSPTHTPRPSFRSLSKRTKRLYEGRCWTEYELKHQALMALLVGLVNAGWTDQQILEDLIDENRCPAATILKEKYKGGVINQITSRLRRARAHVELHHKKTHRWFLEVLADGPRKNCSSMYRAAAALAIIARKSGSTTFTASMRQIAERSGLGTATVLGADTKTARRALQRLEKEGFIKKGVRHSHRNDEPRTMTEIELLFRGGSSSPTIPDKSRCDSEGDESPLFIQGKFSLEDLLHPVWEHTGLGFTAFRVWASVRSIGPVSAGTIATKLGLSSRQVRNVLTSKLEEYYLLSKDPNGLWVSTERDLDEVADEIGVTLRPIHRKLAFERERANRSKALKERFRNPGAHSARSSKRFDPNTGEILETEPR